jgi:O-antigen/teichoic acid export membrane protein
LATVAKGAGIALAGRASGGALNYAFNVMIGRWLGAGNLGVFSLALTVVTLGMGLGRLGLDQTLLRFVAIYRGEGAPDKTKGTVRLALRVSVVASVLLSAVVIGSAHAIALRVFGKPELTWPLRGLACMLPLGNLALVALAATQACRVMTYVALTQNIITPLVQIGVLALCIAAGYGLGGAVSAVVTAQAVAALLGYRFALRLLPELGDRQVAPVTESARVLRFGAAMALVDISSYLLGWIDILQLGYYVSAYDLGLYHAAARTAGVTTLTLLGINALFAPTMADLFNRGELVMLERLFKTTATWAITAGLPLFLLCALQGGVVLALFGPEFPAAALPLALLAAGQFVNAATGSAGYMLVMSGRQNLMLADQLISLAVAIGLNLWLIPRWGVLGAAAAMSFTTAGLNLTRVVQVALLTGLHPYDAGLRRPLLAATGALAAAALARFTISPHGPAALAVTVPVFATVYGALLVAFGLPDEERRLLARLRGRLLALRAGRSVVR